MTIRIFSNILGNPYPISSIYPVPVVNGDFVIHGNKKHLKVGDGCDERTFWEFDFIEHPDFDSFVESMESLKTAVLTLTLRTLTCPTGTDSVQIDTLKAIHDSEIKSLKTFDYKRIHVDLLAAPHNTKPMDILKFFDKLRGSRCGIIPMAYEDDAIVCFARLMLTR